MSAAETFIEIAKANPRRVVLPESDDPRIVDAAVLLAKEKIAHPVLISSQPSPHPDIDCIDPGADEHRITEFAEAYVDNRPRTSSAVAKRLVRKPLFYAGMLLKHGHVDALVAGAANPTSRIIEAGLMTVGLAPGIATPSSFFLMLLPGEGSGRQLIFADCAINIDPDAQQLADIALASAASAEKILNADPKVAMLSFSTHGSAKHVSAQKVIDALQIVREKRPDLNVDGELQADAALSADVAKKKIKTESGVAGEANVLVFPDLNAGNISYKLTQYLASATAIGPVLQGFAQPVCDLSRGASVEDIVASCAITLSMR